jgi:hypothetical protein
MASPEESLRRWLAEMSSLPFSAILARYPTSHCDDICDSTDDNSNSVEGSSDHADDCWDNVGETAEPPVRDPEFSDQVEDEKPEYKEINLAGTICSVKFSVDNSSSASAEADSLGFLLISKVDTNIF